MSAVIYVRRSISADHDGSLHTQQVDCTDWCKRNGITIHSTLSDDGESAYKASKRPAWQTALSLLREGAANTLVVWRLDRLSRRGAGAVGGLLDELPHVRIVATSQGIDSAQAGSRLVLVLLAELARSESETISARVKRSKVEDVASGRWPGGFAPAGYRVNSDRRLVLVPSEAEVLRQLVEQVVREGLSVRGAVALLNDSPLEPRRSATWAVSSVSRMLRAPTLFGVLPDRRRNANGVADKGLSAVRRDDSGELVVVVDGDTVLSHAEYRELQATLDSRCLPTGRAKRTGRYLLSGLLRCRCGFFRAYDRSTEMYRCPKRGRLGCREPGVHKRFEDEIGLACLVRFTALEPWEIAALRLGPATPALGSTAVVEDLEARLASLGEALAEGLMAPEQHRKLATKLTAELEGARAQAEPTQAPLLNVDIAEGSPLEAWEDMPAPARRRLVKALVSEVQDREIVWRL